MHPKKTKTEEKTIEQILQKVSLLRDYYCRKRKEGQLAHRRERRIVRQILGSDPLRPVLPHRREVSNVWSFDKDGKQRLSGNSPDYLKIMRK